MVPPERRPIQQHPVPIKPTFAAHNAVFNCKHKEPESARTLHLSALFSPLVLRAEKKESGKTDGILREALFRRAALGVHLSQTHSVLIA